VTVLKSKYRSAVEMLQVNPSKYFLNFVSLLSGYFSYFELTVLSVHLEKNYKCSDLRIKLEKMNILYQHTIISFLGIL
jgi:hypothetical protein